MPSFVPVTRALLLRLLALDVLDRRKPQERTRRASVSMMPICDYDDC
jgi:hypothetical protein